MSILNPNGQPAFLLKGSSMQDASQHVQMALPSHGTSPLKTYQLSSTIEKASVTIAREELSRQGQSLYGASDVGTSTDDISDGSSSSICNLSHPLRQPFAPSFMQGLMENDKLSTVQDVSKEYNYDLNSSKSSDDVVVVVVVVISVSSAVKLDDRQIDLISRKMQRLTGFRKLRLENIVDPSLIAGFVISYCNDGLHVVDLSVKGQLAMLEARLESSEQKMANPLGDFPTP